MRGEVSAEHCNWSPSRPHAWVRPSALLFWPSIHWLWKASVLPLSQSTLKALTALSTQTQRDVREVQASCWSALQLDKVGQPPLVPRCSTTAKTNTTWSSRAGWFIHQKDSCVLELSGTSLDSQSTVAAGSVLYRLTTIRALQDALHGALNTLSHSHVFWLHVQSQVVQDIKSESQVPQLCSSSSVLTLTCLNGWVHLYCVPYVGS